MLWVPSHVGIEGNEKADKAAKAASRSSRTRSLEMEADDLKPEITKVILAEWQDRWQSEPECALRRLRPNLGRWESSSNRNRYEEVAPHRARSLVTRSLVTSTSQVTRLRSGRCHATHSHHRSPCLQLLQRTPESETCFISQ